MRPKKAEVKTRPEKETGEKTAPNISGSETAGPERWEREEEETAVCETCELVDAAAVLERIAEGQEFQPAPAAQMCIRDRALSATTSCPRLS